MGRRTSANICPQLQRKCSSHKDSSKQHSKNEGDKWIGDGVDGNRQQRPIVGGGSNHWEERETTMTTATTTTTASPMEEWQNSNQLKIWCW
jgi:hypothetical protein